MISLSVITILDILRIPLVTVTETSQMKWWKGRGVGTARPEAAAVRAVQLCASAACVSSDHSAHPWLLWAALAQCFSTLLASMSLWRSSERWFKTQGAVSSFQTTSPFPGFDTSSSQESRCILFVIGVVLVVFLFLGMRSAVYVCTKILWRMFIMFLVLFVCFRGFSFWLETTYACLRLFK